MEGRERFECVKCEGVGHIEHEQDHHFYTITFCPFCAEELELEPDLDLTNIYEQEYEANN
tara:strand:- start:2323 stop:2502 length:180 start_codon:yes stop_codon:yes gene_type:complete